MRRVQVHHLIALVGLGLVLNFAVAWLCAGWITVGGSRDVSIAGAAGSQDVVVRESWLGRTRINRAHFTELSRDAAGNLLTVRWAGDGTERSELQAGWPMRSMYCVNFADIDINLGSSRMGMNKTGMNPIVGGIELPPSSGPWRALPYQPLWLGFVFNTVFWSGMAYLAFLWAMTWRRNRRLKRGMCVGCGYDLTGAMHDQCPECGAAVVARSMQAQVISESSEPQARLALREEQ